MLASAFSLAGVARADDADTAILPGVQALADALKDKDADVRKNAALSLGRYGDKAVPAVPALIEALKDGAVDVRGAAAVALGRIGPPAKDAASGLADLLKDKQADVRGAAALALLRIGKAANSAVPALTDATKAGDALTAVYASAQAGARRGAPIRMLTAIGRFPWSISEAEVARRQLM